MRVLIGTPAYGYQVTAEYHGAVLRLVKAFAKQRPEVTFDSLILGSALLAFNRNVLATRVLQEQRYTHLLFIDADMGFQPDLIARMLDFGEPIVGCIPPQRARRLERIYEAARRGESLEKALDAGTTYAGTPMVSEGKVAARGDFVRMSRLGTGIMLIQRGALEKMREACPEIWLENPSDPLYRDAGVPAVLQAFDTFQGPEGVFYGEDVAFCRRWVDRCGGELWACFDAQITHVGRETVIGNYAGRLRPGAS